MAQQNIILWGTPDVFEGMPIIKNPEPAHDWDEGTGRPAEAQMTRNGLPVWQAEALMGVGWSGDPRPVTLRITSATRPNLAVDGARIAALFAAPATASAHPQQTAAKPKTEAAPQTQTAQPRRSGLAGMMSH